MWSGLREIARVYLMHATMGEADGSDLVGAVGRLSENLREVEMEIGIAGFERYGMLGVLNGGGFVVIGPIDPRLLRVRLGVGELNQRARTLPMIVLEEKGDGRVGCRRERCGRDHTDEQRALRYSPITLEGMVHMLV